MIFDQSDFDLRCEWGENGVKQLAPISDVVIVVDILSFSTCVEIATCRGAIIIPYRWENESARGYAISVNAELAGRRAEDKGYTLSPRSLLDIPAGTKLVLPSPNGSRLSLSTGSTPTFAGCLRNCRAVAQAAMKIGRRIALIPAGEQWSDGSLRPAFEDLVGAGAIISHLEGSFSPEAMVALTAYKNAQLNLEQMLKHCGSGRELTERGFERDVSLAAELAISDCAPILTKGNFINQTKD
jgi:2-phosphosulfolactate phosphatase